VPAFGWAPVIKQVFLEMLHKHSLLLSARSASEKLLIVSHAGNLGIKKFAVLQI
jgi:hypothetical protein